MRILNYNEALDLVQIELSNSGLSTLKFCEKHSLNYKYVLEIRNNKSSTLYPKLLRSLLDIFFDVKEYKIIHQYSIED